MGTGTRQDARVLCRIRPSLHQTGRPAAITGTHSVRHATGQPGARFLLGEDLSADRRAAYLRLATSTYSRRIGPMYSCRGRPMRMAGSEIISCQCATQPTVRAMANITV